MLSATIPVNTEGVFAPERSAEDALRKEAKDEVRVALPMDGWEELEYLVHGGTEELSDLPSVLLRAWEDNRGRAAKASDDVCCEGEEESGEWAFYVHGFTADELLPLVQQAIPDDWMVSVVPTPDGVHSGAQITVTRR